MICFTQIVICLRSILRTLVAVEDESISGLFFLQDITHRICHKRCRHVCSNPKAEYHLTILVDDRT